MKKFIVGNWKMHGEHAMAHTLTLAIADAADQLSTHIKVILCPPAVLIAQVATWLVGSVVEIGAQDCHMMAEGAFTGDIGAPLLKAAGCSHVIVGHSERRKYHHEQNNEVQGKALQAIKSGLIPIICIGETLDERQSGNAETIVGKQVKESLPESVKADNFLLAYEPVWAIGSGKTPSNDDIRQMHTYIKHVASEITGIQPDQIDVLYGGSVKADNAREIMATPGVSGVLVGGASLKAEEFSRIVASAY